MAIDWFSPAQCVGYAAFVLGVASFLQKDDRRFKIFMAAECLAYIIHFALLGRPTAVASSTMSLLRSVLALYTRSIWVALLVIAANLALGLTFATQYAFNGRQAEIDYVITVFEAPHRYGIRATSGPFPFESVVVLEEVPEGTSMTYTIDAGSDSKATSVIFALFGPLLRKAMTKRLNRQLEDLKALV